LTSSLEELKSKILELLKKDEEFRYAVAGLIGLDRILDELKKLREDFNKLYEKSLEHDKRFEEINRRFEAIEGKLLEHDKRFEAIEKKLLEHDKRFESIEKKLLEHDKRLEAIERKLLEHDKRFEAIEKKLLEHDKKFEELSRRLDRVERRLNRVELELGALNEAFFSRSLWEDLREEIKASGEKVVMRKRNARIDDEDIDLLIVTDKKVYVVEVKIKPKHGDVGRLLAKADLVRKHYRDKKVVTILTGTMIDSEVEEYAREKGVRVYSY
jgi:hypothetical protein